jgi:broad specificity phosphatase PhoE
MALMIKMRILLLRHAESIDNIKDLYVGQKDSPLSPKGKRQVKALAKALAKEKIDFIYSSPLQRAKNLAEAIAKTHKKSKFFIAPELLEINQGIFQGKKRTEKTREKYLWYFLHPNKKIPKGESLNQVISRLRKFLKRINKYKNSNKTILIVSHRRIIYTLMALLLKWDLKTTIQMRQDTASITEIKVYKKRAVLERFNSAL